MQLLPPILQTLLFFIINFIEASFNDIIIWFHISVSHVYIVICIKFSLEWIYFSVLRHALGINDNPVIKFECKSHHPYIIGEIIELSRSYCCRLDVPGLSSEEQQDRKIHHWVGIFSCLLYSLQINIHVTSILHFVYMCLISVIPGIFTYLTSPRRYILPPPQQSYKPKLKTTTQATTLWKFILSADTINTIIITFIINTASSLMSTRRIL